MSTLGEFRPEVEQGESNAHEGYAATYSDDEGGVDDCFHSTSPVQGV